MHLTRTPLRSVWASARLCVLLSVAGEQRWLLRTGVIGRGWLNLAEWVGQPLRVVEQLSRSAGYLELSSLARLFRIHQQRACTCLRC